MLIAPPESGPLICPCPGQREEGSPGSEQELRGHLVGDDLPVMDQADDDQEGRKQEAGGHDS